MTSVTFQPAPGGAVIDYADPSTRSLTQVQATPVQAAPRAGWLVRYRLWVLLGITLLGGVMRFSFLDKPPLWGDEGYTFSRVCGDFKEFLDVLQYDGFPPLHYELYWVIRQFTQLTPRTMRFIPALAGTLMIPAMYFLAAQLTGKRTALLVALFTCCSAYMMVYSRDAKMYMACWLFVALNFGCFLWWLRAGSRIAWLAWIASGLAMGEMHLLALVALAIQPLMLLTQKPGHWRWKQPILLVLGMAIIIAGPAGYRLGFNKWTEQVEEEGFASGSGVGWVEPYNRGRTGPDLALFAATAHLFSWEWPSPVTQGLKPGINPDTMHGLMIAGTILLLFLAIGVMPWRRGMQRVGSTLAEGVAGGQDAHGSGEIPSAKADPTVLDDPPAEPWWRQVLWLGLWIMLPAYGFYCASMREFASPLDWIVAVGDLFEQHWLVVGLEVALLVVVSQFWRALPRYLAAAIPIAGFVVLNAILLNAGLMKLRDKEQWHAAYWPIFSRWWDIAGDQRVIVGLIGVLPVIAWHFCGATLAERSKKSAQMLLVAAAIFGGCYGVYRGFGLYLDREAKKMTADHHEAPQWEMLVQYALADHGAPTRAAAIQKVRTESPNLSAALVEKRADERIAQKQQRWKDLVSGIANEDRSLTQQQALRKAAGQLGSERAIWDRWVSTWMPRYVGACWPAVAIAACALLLRLPTRPLRYIAIGLVVALNLGQATARVFAGSEPPMDRIAADVAAAQETLRGKPVHTNTRTYLNQMTGFSIGHPGTLAVFGQQGKYYLAQASGASITPLEFRRPQLPPSGGVFQPFKLKIVYDQPPQAIVADLQRSPEIQRAIIWEHAERGTATISDRVAAGLGPDWRLASDQTFHGRMHWTWQENFVLRRREYVRQPKIPT